MDSTNSLTDIISGKSAIQVEIPTQNIIFLSVGIFIAVLLAVVIANQIMK